jgi:hypothetical protein
MLATQRKVMRGLAFLSSGALVIVAMSGRDPLLFGVGLFTMISNEIGLFSLGAKRRPALRGREMPVRRTA